jgi:hypothetical protein
LIQNDQEKNQTLEYVKSYRYGGIWNDRENNTFDFNKWYNYNSNF